MSDASEASTRARKLERLQGIYALADDDPRWPASVDDQVEAALAAGITVIQLRAKHLCDRDALALATRLAKRVREAGALFIVNDRYDIADLAGADGVHVGADDLPPEQIPSEIRARLLVGLSTHTREQVAASRSRPCDYVGFGPVFGTASKVSEYTPRGLEALSEAVQLCDRPVVAIGGIDASNVASVRTAGARAAAVISAIAAANDPARASRALVRAFARDPAEHP